MKRALALIEQQKANKNKAQGFSDDPDEKQGDQHFKGSGKQTRMPSATRNIHDSDQTKLISGSDSKHLLRKNTMASSTTRVGSGGKESVAKSFISSSGRAGLEYHKAQDTKQPLYMLSLAGGNSKKPPHKLKPLNTAKQAVYTMQDADTFQMNISKSMLKDLDNEMNEYLDVNQIVNGLENAFQGSNERKKEKPQRRSTPSNKTTSALQPILEESDSNQQVVPFQASTTSAEQRLKKNELLKKQVKMITGSENVNTNINSSDDKNTFLTACQQNDPNQLVIVQSSSEFDETGSERSWKPKKHYKYMEDELLDEVDQHERDMNDMLKYLSEVEDLIKGQDLKSIQSMMDVTKDNMDQHFQAYDKLKDSISTMNKQAEDAIESLSFYDYKKGSKKSKNNGIGGMQLERIAEYEDYEAETIKPSQEKSKVKIVDSLMSMNQSMREFTTDIERKLDSAYKSGVGKKYGYDSVSNLSQTSMIDKDSEKDKKDNKAINKLAFQAQSYLDKQNIMGGGMSNMSQAGKKSVGGMKALSYNNDQTKSGIKKGKAINADIE